MNKTGADALLVLASNLQYDVGVIVHEVRSELFSCGKRLAKFRTTAVAHIQDRGCSVAVRMS